MKKRMVVLANRNEWENSYSNRKIENTYSNYKY